jgi:anti-anti-sigma regulatory factor
MLLRIAEERLGDLTVVHVAGRLVGEGAGELSRVCTAGSRPLRIDLSGLLQADELGLSLLRSLRASGAELAGVSPFISLLLEGGRDRAAG